MKTLHRLPSFLLALALSGCIAQTKNTLVDLEKGELPEKPTLVNLQINKYTPTSGRNFKEIFVSNFSERTARGKAIASQARDGLGDDFKTQLSADYGFGTASPHSANSYFSDLMLYLSGIQYSQQALLYCASNMTESSSNDIIKYTDTRVNPAQLRYLGLRDCEKAYLGLNPNTFDFDKDGIPDYLELRCGLNPKNPNDAALNPTGDGVTQLEKCKRHIPIDESADSDSNKLYGYKYKIEIQNDGTRTFTISNIPVINDGSRNLIAIYLLEVDPMTSKTYLFTAYTQIKPDPRYDPYKFDFWASGPSTAFNQEIVFP